jgi:hypothetical protein
MIYLYVKTHNLTGLKYLGKTTHNPYNYNGSGKYWQRHLKEHGYSISTEIIFQTKDKEVFKNTAIFYSKLWNIVKSNEWANLTLEEGQGGSTNKGRKFGPKPEHIREKLRVEKGPRGPQKNPRKSGYKRPNYNPSPEARALMGRKGIPRGIESAKKAWITRRTNVIKSAVVLSFSSD